MTFNHGVLVVNGCLRPSVDINVVRFTSGINIDLGPQQTLTASNLWLSLILWPSVNINARHESEGIKINLRRQQTLNTSNLWLNLLIYICIIFPRWQQIWPEVDGEDGLEQGEGSRGQVRWQDGACQG